MDFEEKYGFTPAPNGEMQGFEYTIPNGFTTEIKDDKVIVKKQESEDERIRKVLLEYFNERNNYRDEDETFFGVPFPSIIAYLEEQKIVDEYDLDFAKQLESLRKVQREKNLPELIEMRWKTMSDGDKAELSKESFTRQAKFFFEVGYEKQKEQKPLSTEKTELNSIAFLEQMGYTCIPPGKEQKPAECIEFDNEFKNQVSHLLASVLNKEWEYNKGFVEYVSQQLLEYAKNEINPAEWSEEDEMMLEQAIKCVNNSGKLEVSTEEIEEWLKSLSPQPKQEWSKEDEGMMDNLIQHLKVAYSQCDWLDKTVDWLKSLRNRPKSSDTWKPSEEEMAALQHAIDACECEWGYEDYELRSLLSELQTEL